MKTEDIDKRIGMPDVDAEWTKFEREVIGNSPAGGKPKAKQRSMWIKVAAAVVIALGFSGAIIAEVYQGQMRAEKDLAIDTTCQTLPLVEFCESAHWGPKNRGRMARNIYTINMAFGTWVEVDGKKGHLEEIYLRQRYAESLLKGKLTLKLDGRTFDRNSLPKLTNKDLRKVETTHDGNDLTINLVTKEVKVPMEVIGNLPRAMTILLPGKGDVGLTYYKAKEGNWMNSSCTSWGTDGNDFGLPQEFERVKKVIGFKAYIYASREAGQADIDRAKRLLEKVGIGDVTVKTNLPIRHLTDAEVLEWAQQEKARSTPYGDLYNKMAAKQIPLSDVRKQWHIVKKVYGK